MKVFFRLFRAKALRITFLAGLLPFLALSSCNPELEKATSLNSPEASYNHIHTGKEPLPMEVFSNVEPSWEKCTVRVVNYLFGTEFYVLFSDGSYSISGTPAICSLAAFNEARCPVESIKTSTLSDEELEELQIILSSLYTKGHLVTVEERRDVVFEGSYVYVSVDDSEEVFFLKYYTEWDGYPIKEYDELIQLVHSLYPQSVILH